MATRAQVAPDEEAVRVARTYQAQRSLGFCAQRRNGFTSVRHDATPSIYDANFVCEVDAELAAHAGRFTSALDEAHEGLGHRKVLCDPRTPPVVEAQLAALGFACETVVQLVLDAELEHPGEPVHPELRIEAVSHDAHWNELVRLQHANFIESCERQGLAPFDRGVAEQMVESWRAKASMTFWLAHEGGGEACAYIGSWPGLESPDGPRLGMVESLFTAPGKRHRGIATALIAHGVEDVRARGAGPVLIGAEIEDTPKQMYQSLGFRPVCLTREWLRMESGA